MFKKVAFLKSIFGICGIFLIQGCAGAILSSTLVGAYFVGSFGSVSEIQNEYYLQKKIIKELEAVKDLKEEIDFDIEPSVLNGKIYLIGVAANSISKSYPMDYIFSKYKNKYKIIDEVKISELHFTEKASDSTIKFKIKAKFIFTNGIRYGNYYIAVYGSEVTVIGEASDKYEASKILDLISSTRGVKKIVNYVEVKDIGD